MTFFHMSGMLLQTVLFQYKNLVPKTVYVWKYGAFVFMYHVI